MSRRARSFRGVSLAFALLVALTACGSSKAKSSSSATTAAKAETTTTAKVDSEADKALGAKINLVAADFPAGWEEGPASSDSVDSDASDKELADCLGVPDPKSIDSASVDSPDFSKGVLTTISSSVDVFKNSDDAKKDLAKGRNSKFTECFKKQLSDVITKEAQGATVGTVTLDRKADPKFGDEGLAYRLVMPLEAAGQKVTLNFDLYIMRKGRVEASLFFLDSPNPVDASLQTSLLGKVGGRLEANA